MLPSRIFSLNDTDPQERTETVCGRPLVIVDIES